jgi:hypothetical protein
VYKQILKPEVKGVVIDEIHKLTDRVERQSIYDHYRIQINYYWLFRFNIKTKQVRASPAEKLNITFIP